MPSGPEPNGSRAGLSPIPCRCGSSADLLGVPREDEPRFSVWSAALVRTPGPEREPDRGGTSSRPCRPAPRYGNICASFSDDAPAQPQDDLISGLVTEDDPAMRLPEAGSAGHNAIAA